MEIELDIGALIIKLEELNGPLPDKDLGRFIDTLENVGGVSLGKDEDGDKTYKFDSEKDLENRWNRFKNPTQKTNDISENPNNEIKNTDSIRASRLQNSTHDQTDTLNIPSIHQKTPSIDSPTNEPANGEPLIHASNKDSSQKLDVIVANWKDDLKASISEHTAIKTQSTNTNFTGIKFTSDNTADLETKNTLKALNSALKIMNDDLKEEQELGEETDIEKLSSALENLKKDLITHNQKVTPSHQDNIDSVSNIAQQDFHSTSNDALAEPDMDNVDTISIGSTHTESTYLSDQFSPTLSPAMTIDNSQSYIDRDELFLPTPGKSNSSPYAESVFSNDSDIDSVVNDTFSRPLTPASMIDIEDYPDNIPLNNSEALTTLKDSNNKFKEHDIDVSPTTESSPSNESNLKATFSPIEDNFEYQTLEDEESQQAETKFNATSFPKQHEDFELLSPEHEESIRAQAPPEKPKLKLDTKNLNPRRPNGPAALQPLDAQSPPSRPSHTSTPPSNSAPPVPPRTSLNQTASTSASQAPISHQTSSGQTDMPNRFERPQGYQSTYNARPRPPRPTSAPLIQGSKIQNQSHITEPYTVPAITEQHFTQPTYNPEHAAIAAAQSLHLTAPNGKLQFPGGYQVQQMQLSHLNQPITVIPVHNDQVNQELYAVQNSSTPKRFGVLWKIGKELQQKIGQTLKLFKEITLDLGLKQTNNQAQQNKTNRRKSI